MEHGRHSETGAPASAISCFSAWFPPRYIVFHGVGSEAGAKYRGRESGINHSPSLRTGQADLPHPALQSVVLPTRGVMNDPHEATEQASPDRRPSHLGIRVITMNPRRDQRSRPRRRRTESPSGTARRHSVEGIDAAVRPGPSTFLRSLRSRPITALPRYYGRGDSCPPRGVQCSGSSQRPLPPLLGEQVSLIHALRLPTIPSPNTAVRSASSSQGALPHQRVGPRELPSGNSGLRLSYAGSPHHTGRIEFSPLLWESLLTDWSFTSCCSPPRLATTQLQSVTSYVDLERTLTSPTKCAFRRT